MVDCISIKEISDEYKQIESEVLTILSQHICTIDGIKKRLKNKDVSDELIRYILTLKNANVICPDDACTIEKLKYHRKQKFLFHIRYVETEGDFLIRIKYKSFWQDKNSVITKHQIKEYPMEIESRTISQLSPDKYHFIKLRRDFERMLLYLNNGIVNGVYFDKFGHSVWTGEIGKIEHKYIGELK